MCVCYQAIRTVIVHTINESKDKRKSFIFKIFQHKELESELFNFQNISRKENYKCKVLEGKF